MNDELSLSEARRAASCWEREALAARPRLVGVARRIVRDDAEAEDAADEAIARLARAADERALPVTVVSWLLQTVLHIAIDRARRWVRRERSEWRTQAANAGARAAEGPEAQLERAEAREFIWRAILELPTRQQEVIVFHDMEECSYDEVSDLLGIPAATLRSHAHAARETLRRKLAKLDRESRPPQGSTQ
ncbi:MAG: RNA polymerase sigma factor [Planctomycetota bacterium]